LIEADRLWDFTHTWDPDHRWQKIEPPVVPTAEQVNEWSLLGFGHDALNAGAVVRARCRREGWPEGCATCDATPGIEAWEGQREAATAWKSVQPPIGEGWQLWESVSEGSPISPVFPTSEALAQWLTTREGGKVAGPSRQPLTIEQAREFVRTGWAPTMISDAAGVHDGVEWIGSAQDKA
jgi:hypothetical protein